MLDSQLTHIILQTTLGWIFQFKVGNRAARIAPLVDISGVCWESAGMQAIITINHLYSTYNLNSAHPHNCSGRHAIVFQMLELEDWSWELVTGPRAPCELIAQIGFGPGVVLPGYRTLICAIVHVQMAAHAVLLGCCNPQIGESVCLGSDPGKADMPLWMQ